MKRRFILAITVLFTIITLGYSATVSIETARLAAKNMYFEQANILGKIDYAQVVFSDVFTNEKAGLPVYYIFNLASGKGWVMVSADDRTVPVPSFSLEGSYNPATDNENFLSWMKNYERQILFAIENNIPQAPAVAELWNYYTAADFALLKSADAVAPLLGSIAWDQGCYFNAQCPTSLSGPCLRCPTGCVATAMAMIMKKWAYPTHGYSTHSYTHPNYGTLSADYGATTYNWSSMPNSITSANSAVATLMKQAGVSVNMNYQPSGSGALLSYAKNALSYYFVYNSGYEIKSAYTDSAWLALLKGDLDLGRPMIYGGQDVDGGHAFVCDGYQGTNNDYFHFNWGWSGNDNSYNYLTSIIPGNNAQNGDFTADQEVVLHIYPSPQTAPVAAFTVPQTTVPPNTTLTFTDHSTNTPLEWLWSVTPSTGAAFIYTTSASQNPKIKFTNSGYYTISLTATNAGGSDTETKTNFIHITGTAGVDETNLATEINIYPNPSTGKVFVETGQFDAGKMKLMLTDILGNTIGSMNAKVVSSELISLDISSLAKGLYYLNLKADQNSVTRKIVLTD